MRLVPSLGRALPLGLLLSVLFAPIHVSATDEPAAKPTPRVLTSALAIRKMSLQQAKQGYPVRLKGVITFYDPEQPDLFVQDSTSGIWINTEIVKPNVPIRVGDLVEVEGVTEAPDFAPQVGNPRLRILGHVSLPPARPVSFERMASTQEDSQRVEVEGIVQVVAGMDGYISKPIRTSEMFSTIEEVLNRFRNNADEAETVPDPLAIV